MFGSLAFVPMGEKHNYAVREFPLFERHNYKVIYYNLRAVCKISELSFPHNESERIGGAVSVFEAENRRFGK